MRGHDEQTTHMFSYLSPEQRVPADHPLRAVRALTDEALQTMSRRFASLYATPGRPSIPPEQLLRALLLQVLYTVRSERLLMEELNDNLLFRWFVGLNMDDPVWHPTTFTKNRDRLLSGDVAAAFFDAVQAHARAAGLLSDEHFTVDGTQLEAWASLKSFRCVDAAESDPPEDPGNPTVNFHGERRRNDTHQSTTDPEAMLHRKGKGKEAKLAYLGHVLLDNRQGLVANVCATHATGTAERDAAVLLLEASASPGSTVGADKGYDVARFVADVRVQGEFNWSSQHLDDEVLRCRDGNGDGQTGRVGLRCVRLVGRRQRGVRSSNGSGRRSRGGCRVRMPLCPVACRRPWVGVGSAGAGVCRRSAWRPDRLATCPLRSGKRSRSCERRAPGCVTWPVGSGEPRRLSRESYVATRRLGAAVWRIGRRLRSGTAPDVPSARR